VSETDKKPDTEEAATKPDLFIPVEQQRVTRYQDELKKHTQGQEKKFTVATRTSINSTLQHKAGIEEQKNVLKIIIPTVAIIFILFLTAVQMLIPQYLMLAIFLAPAITVSTLLASTKVNRNSLKSASTKLKSVGKLKEKLKRKPKIPTAPAPAPATSTVTSTPPTPTVPKPKKDLHIKQKLASDTIPILLLPITTAACAVLYLLEAPYYIVFWIILLGFCYSYVFKVWLRTRHIQIRISVKKHGKPKKTK
jgi:hypothetical protein